MRKRKWNPFSSLRNKRSTIFRDKSMNYSMRFSNRIRRIYSYKRILRSPRKLKTITDPRSKNFMQKIQNSGKKFPASSVRSTRA